MSKALYKGFEVAVRPTAEYQSVETRLHVEYPAPVSAGDMIGDHEDARAFAQELAVSQLRALLGRGEDITDPAVETTTTTTPAAAPQQATQSAPPAQRTVEWAEGKNPRGETFQYRPSSNLRSESFKTAVAKKIDEAGYDSSLFVVYDERIGPRGLEAGGSSYGPASVKPTKEFPGYDAMVKGRGVQSAFFVDFTKDGGVKVNPTKALKAAEAPAPAADADVPF